MGRATHRAPRPESAAEATFEVTGTTAPNIDIAEKVQAALMPYPVTVVGLVVVVFQEGHGASPFGVKQTGPIMSAMPIFLVGLDAFVVRMALVPAVLGVLGERAWWLPRRLERFPPRVDVEGEALGRREPRRPVPAPVQPEAVEAR